MPKHDNPVAQKRRLALKALTGSAVAGGLVDKLPSVWQRPLVHGSVLPVHAQSSPEMENTGQVQLSLSSPSEQLETNLPVTYMIDRNSNGQITHIRIPTGNVSASSAMDALFPAAYAQTSNFIVQREFVIAFGSRQSASANLEFSLEILSQTITCTLRITAYLTQSRMALDRLVASPAECGVGDFEVRPIMGPNSDFNNDPNPPSTPAVVIDTPPTPPDSIPESERRFEWSWVGDKGVTITGEFRTREMGNRIAGEDLHYHQITITVPDRIFRPKVVAIEWQSFNYQLAEGNGPNIIALGFQTPYFRSVETYRLASYHAKGKWIFYHHKDGVWELQFFWTTLFPWGTTRTYDTSRTAPTITPIGSRSPAIPIPTTLAPTTPAPPTPIPTTAGSGG